MNENFEQKSFNAINERQKERKIHANDDLIIVIKHEITNQIILYHFFINNLC